MKEDDPYVPTRRLVGYGAERPEAGWPGGARVAVNFVVNYEEGAEYSPQEGDAHAESILTEVAPSPPVPGARDRNVESLYEYGSAVGIWRLIKAFRTRGVTPTFYVVGRALEVNPAVGAAMASLGGDFVGHGWRWIDYRFMDEETERLHMARTAETIERLTGSAPQGWYTGRPSLNTRRLAVEQGFAFDSDDYNDDLPYWVEVAGKAHLVIPHSFDNNDSRFSRGSGLETAEQFFSYLRDGFDWLIEEGTSSMMTVSLHCRLIGRPGRMAGLARFIDHVKASDGAWIATRSEIAAHWRRHHPPS